jgi:hypothetical protein
LCRLCSPLNWGRNGAVAKSRAENANHFRGRIALSEVGHRNRKCVRTGRRGNDLLAVVIGAVNTMQGAESSQDARKNFVDERGTGAAAASLQLAIFALCE